MAILRGHFFVIEGVECAGKSTQIEEVRRRLIALHLPVFITREPGGSEIGEEIRVILKNPHHGKGMDPVTSLFLFNAARRQFVREIVGPRLKKGEIVLTDRFFLSTLAYQGYAEGLDIEFVRALCLKTLEGTRAMPQKIFLIDISLEEMARRVSARGNQHLDRYDQMDLSFHKKVREGYLAEWERGEYPIEKIDGERSAEAVTEELVSKIIACIDAEKDK